MKTLAVILLAGTITVQAEAADLSQRIAKINPSLDTATVTAVARALNKYPPVMTYIAKRESTFNPTARSNGCIGLTGINVKVWMYHLIMKGIIRNPHDLWIPEYSVKAGWYVYKKCNKSYRKYRGLR